MAGDLDLLLPRPQYVDSNAGAVCLAFLNSTDQPNGFSHRDDLQPGYANMLSWARAAGVVSDEDARRLLGLARRNAREASAVRRTILEFRGSLFRIIQGGISGVDPDPADLAVFEQELRNAYARARLTVAEDDGRLVWAWPGEPYLEQPLWTIARSAGELLFSDQRHRIRECASEDCQRIFLDTTRNRSRQYCSTGGCGNRERVRKFRQNPTDT